MCLKVLLLFLVPGMLLAQQKQNTTIPVVPSTIQKVTTQPPTKPASVPELTKEEVLIPEKKQVVGTGGHFFPHPGVVYKKAGKWTGGEHLYNLDKDINIYVEIDKTKDIREDVDKKKIKDLIASLFLKTTIIPDGNKKQPPSPFYHLLIMITPIDKGYAVYCSARLFESIRISRVELVKDVEFQAITWEKQILLVAPKDKLNEEILGAVQDLTKQFVEQFRQFEELKQQKASDIR